MEPINVNLSCDIQQPVKVRYLDGYFFSKDSAGHRINVDVFDNGVPVSVGGSVSADVIRSDGETVPVTGAVSGNRAYVILPQAAYAIVGAVQITIKVTEGTTIVTIASFVAYVHESDTDITVDPGTIIPSIQALISQIETAVASIPADYSSLWTSLAPAFSTSTAYAVGQYVTNSGVLYRFTTAHPAGTWNSAHVTAVNLGSDISALKSALKSSTGTEAVDNWVSGKAIATNTDTVNINSPIDATNYRYAVVPCVAGDYFIINATGGSTARAWAVIDENGAKLDGATGSGAANNKRITCPTNSAYMVINDSSDRVSYKGKLLIETVEAEIAEREKNDLLVMNRGKAGMLAETISEKLLPGYFLNGTHDNNGNYNASYKYRVTNEKPIRVIEKAKYSIETGFSVNVVSINDSGTVISHETRTGDMILNNDRNYWLTIRRATEDTSEVADVSDFLLKVKLLEISYDGFSEESIINQINANTDRINLLPALFVRGSIDTSGVYHADYAYRIATQNKVNVDQDTVFAIKDGFSVNIVRYDATGTKIAHETNITTRLWLKQGSYYDVTIRRVTEDTTETADLREFMEAVYINRETINKTNHLRILVFGHSYSADSWQYVPFILKKYGITCEIYLYYRGNDSIHRLVQEWNDTSAYGTDEFGISHIRRMCHVDTRYHDYWDQSTGLEGYSPKMVLEMVNDPSKNIEKWDLITLQTAPIDCYFVKNPGSPDPRKGQEPWIRKAIELINASYKDNYALGWFSVYTRILPYGGNQQAGYPPVPAVDFDNRVDTLRAAETIYKTEPFDMVIPAAAAVFNARTNPALASDSVSDIGNLWYSDQVHLQNGIPCYIANLTVVQSIFDKFFPGYCVLGEQTRLTDEMIYAWRGLMPSIHGDVLSSDESLYELAQKCAVAACQHPFDITPIYSTTDDTQMEFFDTRERYWADDLIENATTLEIVANGGGIQQSGDA